MGAENTSPVIIGTESDDFLSVPVNGGSLAGLGGNDTYRWTGGIDEILDCGGDDTVEIAFDGHLTWSYEVGTDNLLIAADSGATLIVRHFFNPENGIERFTFSNGDVLTRADVLARLPFPPHEEPPPPPPREEPPLPPEHPHGPVVIVGTEGNDDLNAPTGVSAAMNGLGGDDILIGSYYDDTLDGGAGDDQMIGGAGNDTYLWRPLTGSHDFIADIDGDDTLRIDATAGELTFNRDGNGNSLVISQGNSSLMIQGYFGWFNGNHHIEKIVFSDGLVWHLDEVLAAVSDAPPPPPHEEPPPPPLPPEEPPHQPGEIHGTGGNDLLVGGAEDNLIVGYDGDDTLDGGTGNNVLVGGFGNDTYRWTGGNDVIVDHGGDDTVEIGLDGHLTWSYQVGTDDLLISSDSGSTLIVKHFFNPAISIERFTFLNGDVLTRADVLARLPFPPHEEPPPPPPHEEPPLPPENPPPDEHPDPQPDPVGRLIVGTAGNDVLVGGDGHDTLDGGAGQDLLKGGAGNDTYRWALGSGNDTISDASGTDTLSIFANSSEVTLTASGRDFADLTIGLHGQTLVVRDYFVVTASGGYLENIAFADGQVWQVDRVWQALQTRIGGKGNDIIVGNDLANILKGGSGRDKLNGGKGNDRLFGEHDKDVLTGGEGRDVFVFTKASDAGLGKNRDTITDFKCGFDRIDLSGIDANALTKADNSFTKLLSGKVKFTAAGQLRYDAKTGILSGNTDKDAAAEFEIQLKSKLHLKLSDFVL
ncbi:calcium-binding protein [Microvirga sp. M2]|uniref:calcium-binding protein n=1 Tax=Microvirga sp. M2 TaxID=3073270 RepID=UPI0039C274A3